MGGAQWMVAKNSDSGSIFYNKLDTSKIGALGHSQGAGGVLNAVLLQPTLFDERDFQRVAEPDLVVDPGSRA